MRLSGPPSCAAQGSRTQGYTTPMMNLASWSGSWGRLGVLVLSLLGEHFHDLTVRVEHLKGRLDRAKPVGEKLGTSGVPRLAHGSKRAVQSFGRRRLALVQQDYADRVGHARSCHDQPTAPTPGPASRPARTSRSHPAWSGSSFVMMVRAMQACRFISFQACGYAYDLSNCCSRRLRWSARGRRILDRARHQR